MSEATMSDSDASLPLPSPADSGGGDVDDKGKSASHNLGHGTDDSNSDSGSSPGKIPTPSTPKNGRDSMPHSLTLLEDIPYPTDVDTSQVPNQDHDDIPLPPDSSRYSPSQVTPGDDENESMMSPSESTEVSSLDKKPSTVTMKVLGSAQAKKRLLAFSASKQVAVSYSPLNKKISPLKGVSVFHQAANKKEITKEQTLAIASIKEEETKMKEILAMNSILNEKLKQVKSITENIPKAPPITAVVNPTVVTSENFRISDISSKEEEIFSKKSSASANSRNLRKKRTSSSSRSRSRSHSVSKSPSLDSRIRKRDKHSRSRSRERGRERDKDRRDRDRGDRDRIREKEKKSSSRKSRSRTRSPKIKKEKKRSKSRSRSPKHKRDKDKSRKRSKSRSHSRDRGGRKRSPKIENKKEYDSRDRDRERSRQREKERELEREKEKERERKESEKKREEEKKREREEAAERELDKVRKVRMPYDWTDYDLHQFRTTDIHKLWGAIVIKSSRSRSPIQSDAKGSNPSKEVPQPTPLSKTLSKQLKSMNVIPVESVIGGSKDYPTSFVKNTKSKPSITYGCNTLTYSGYYKSRQQVFKDEEADVMHAMSEIISQKGSTVKQFPSSSDVWKSKKKQQEWFAPTDQVFCPSEGSKGIVISHLYSDDEGDDSPAGSLKGRKPTNVNDRTVEITPIPVLQQKSPSSPDSMDSAPSPLLKKKYNSDEQSGKDTIGLSLDKEVSHVEERGKRDSSSYGKTSSDEDIRIRDVKKSDKVTTNPVLTDDKERDKNRKPEKLAESDKSKSIYSVADKPISQSRRTENTDVSPKIQDEEDDDMYEEMELEEFPLEKEIAANIKTSDKEKKDKDKHKGKESKDKSKKAKKQKRKKKHHKSKDKHEKKKSSDDEEEEFDVHDSSDADSARLKTSKKSSKKDKTDKTVKEKRHRKRRSKTESSKGSDSSSDSEHSDDSSKKRPKKKRTKLSTTNDDLPIEKSLDTKKSKSSAHEPLVPQPLVEKEKSRKDKKKKHEKSKSKKKHSKKNRESSSSSSTESSESESSSSSESSSDTSDEGSDNDRKVKKAEKKKKSKKDKKESKKDKVRDKTPDSSNDENHRRGGGRRDDRGGGGGLGGSTGRSGGSHYHKEFKDRDRDQSYRERDRDRGGDKRSSYGRRRNGEFGELFDSLGDWDATSSSLQVKDNDKCTDLPAMPTEAVKEQSGNLSHSSKQAQELLSAIDNDKLLQTILKNEDLSAETLLKQITEPAESDIATVGSKSVYNLATAPAPSNWSDDSEEENAAAAAAGKPDVKIPPSSGYGTERSTDTIKDNESDEKSGGSDSNSSSEDSTDSESSSSSSDSQSDSDSNNAKEKTELPTEVNESEIKSNENKVSSQVPVLYDPFADNSDATSGSSDSEKKEKVEVKKEKINNIISEDVYKEDNKFYEDLKNTMDVLTKYENKVDASSSNDTIKELETQPVKIKQIDELPGTPTKTCLDQGVEISPTKLLNFKISGSKLDRSSLTAFGTEENTDELKSTESCGTKPISPQKKEKTIPVITSKDHVEQFPISVLGSTCNKITPIPNVTMFTEEHINLGVDNYRCDSRENHERSRYIKPVPALRSRSRSYSRSHSRSRSRSFSPHRRVPSGAPPARFHRSGSYERERAGGRPHRRRSPPPEYFHGRRQYGGDRRRHYNHPGHPGDLISRRRERERFRRPMSRSKSRSRSRSRSISRSRSRSISPRSHGSGYHHRSRRLEMHDRDRRGRGHYFEPRDHRDRRYLRERDYHDRERSRTPEHLSPTELRMRKKHGEFMEDRLSHEERVALKDRENKLTTDNDGDLVPLAQKQESPPLQLNVADSTISDSELASRNATSQVNTGNIYIGGISRDMLIDHHNSGHMELPHPHESQLHPSHLPPETLDNDLCSDYNSPPRRLSLDERLEMEMGISLRDEPVHKPQQIPGGYYYPPNAYRMPGHEHPDQGKYLPVLPHAHPGMSEFGHHPGAIPNAWSAAGKGFANGKPQRAQSQIVQVGNVIQVVPAEIPVVPITITSSSKGRRSSSERKKPSVPKRVITIKVPVVPFSVPIMQPEDLANMQPPPMTEEENLIRLRRKNRKLKRKRRMAAELAKKRNSTIGEEEDVTPAENKEEETQEASPKENLQLKGEENQSETEVASTSVEQGETKTDEEPKLEVNPEDQSAESAPTATTEKDESESKVLDEKKEEPPQKPPPRKIEILPPPDKGILVAAGFREKTLDENNEKIIKGVKFADGINPGCGTSSSEGEEMTSPPPPSEMNAISSKKSKILKKKKIKVKIVRKVEEKKQEESKAEVAPEIERPPPPPSPPPCPSVAYPFCPPGILYQVCSQYAVLYAQAMAEKGIDIVFQPSTQIPSMGENLILSDTLGESNLEAPETIDFQASESSTLTTVHDPSYEHSSSIIPSSSESPVQTTGSRIPTIIRTAHSPPMLDDGMDKSDCSMMISPLSSEIVDNSIMSSNSRKRSISKNIVEIPIVDMDCIPNNLLHPETGSQNDLNLDEIPLPMAMSPSKIPVPMGTPPLSFHISSKPKKFIGKHHNKHLLSSKLRKSRPALTTPKFVHSTSSSNIIVTPISDQSYEYNPYPHSDSQCHSQSTGLSPGPAQISISVTAPPPHIPTIPPGVDLSRPPPSFTPPPPGTIDFSNPSPNSSVASALGNGSVSNNSSPSNVSTSISIVVEEQNLSSRTLQKEQDNDIAPPTPPPPGTSPRYVCS